MADNDRIINHEDGQGIKEAIEGITTAVKESISFNIGNGNASGAVKTKNSRAVGKDSFAEGESYAQGVASHAEGGAYAYGDYSHAEGTSIAMGKYSHAGGEGSSADGDRSFAHGHLAKATMEGSFVFGDNAETTSAGQFVIGDSIKADPAAAFVVARNGNNLFEVMKDGRAKVQTAPKEDDDVVRKVDVLKLSSDLNLDNGTGEGSLKTKSPSTVASGDYSLAVGREPKASGDDSVAIGYQASASGDGSVAVGYRASASETDSVALGYKVKNANSRTIAVGNDFTNNSDDVFVVGKHGKTLFSVSGESTDVHGKLFVDDGLTVKGKLIANEYTVVKAESVDTERYTIGLAKGNTEAIASYVGLYATNYDGSTTGALVWDKTGTAYVGDASVDENGKVTDPNGTLQPLMTRDAESALADNSFFIWDATNRKAVATDRVKIDGKSTTIQSEDGTAYASFYGDKYAESIKLQGSLHLTGDGAKAFFGENGAEAENFSPSKDYDLTTKKYVDGNFAGLASNNAFTSVNTFSEKPLGNYYVEDTDDDKTIANKEYVKRISTVEGLDTRYLKLSGGTMTGSIDLGDQNISNINESYAKSYRFTSNASYTATVSEIIRIGDSIAINTRNSKVILGRLGTNQAMLDTTKCTSNPTLKLPNDSGTLATWEYVDGRDKTIINCISAIGQYNHAIKIYAYYTTETNGITTYYYLSAFFEIRSNHQEKITSIDKLYEIGTTGRCVCRGFYTMRNTSVDATYDLLYVDTMGMTVSSAGAVYFAYGNHPSLNPSTLTISTIIGSNLISSNIEDIVF